MGADHEDGFFEPTTELTYHSTPESAKTIEIATQFSNMPPTSTTSSEEAKRIKQFEQFNQSLPGEFASWYKAYKKTSGQSLAQFMSDRLFEARKKNEEEFKKIYENTLNSHYSEKSEKTHHKHAFAMQFDQIYQACIKDNHKHYLEFRLKQNDLDFLNWLYFKISYEFYYGCFDHFFNAPIENDRSILAFRDPAPLKYAQNWIEFFKSMLRLMTQLAYILTLIIAVAFKLYAGIVPEELIWLASVICVVFVTQESASAMINAIAQSISFIPYIVNILSNARNAGRRRWFQILFSVIFEICALLPLIFCLGQSVLYLKLLVIFVSALKTTVDYEKYSKEIKQTQYTAAEKRFEAEYNALKAKFDILKDELHTGLNDEQKQLLAKIKDRSCVALSLIEIEKQKTLSDAIYQILDSKEKEKESLHTLIYETTLLQFRWQQIIATADQDKKKIAYKQKVFLASFFLLLAVILSMYCPVTPFYLIHSYVLSQLSWGVLAASFIACLCFTISTLIKGYSRFSNIYDPKTVIDFRMNLQTALFSTETLDRTQKHYDSMMSLMQEKKIIRSIPKLIDNVKSLFIKALQEKEQSSLEKLIVIYSAHQQGLFGDVSYQFWGEAHPAWHIVQKLEGYLHRIKLNEKYRSPKAQEKEQAALEAYVTEINSAQYDTCLNKSLEELNKRLYLIRYCIWSGQCDYVALDQFFLAIKASIQCNQNNLQVLGLRAELNKLDELEEEIQNNYEKQQSLEETGVFSELMLNHRLFQNQNKKQTKQQPINSENAYL